MSEYNDRESRSRYEELEPMSMADSQNKKADYKDRLRNSIDGEILFFDEDMGRHSSFRAGGKADVFIVPRNKMELVDVLEILADSGEKYMVIGNGSNILVKDTGYKGAIVKIGSAFANIKIDGNLVRAGAGAFLINVSKEACNSGLKGLEFAGGIPGSIGGAVFMNAGAYDEEIKDVISEVRVMSKDGREETIRFPRDLKFGYRESDIQNTEQIVLGATFQLKSDDRDEILAKAKRLNEQRTLKQPVEFPSAGSFFKRPKNNYAGKLIQDAGLKGFQVGGAQVSEKHAGFVINKDKATATDIIELMNQVQKIVKDKFGVELETEVRIIGE